MPRNTGFALLEDDKHKAVSSKGGRAKVSKGFALQTPEMRKINARKGLDIR